MNFQYKDIDFLLTFQNIMHVNKIQSYSRVKF